MSRTMDNAGGRRMLSHALFGLLLLSYVLGYRSTLETLVGVWAGDGTFQYAFLIVPISVFLIWSRRREVAACDFAPSMVGLLLVAAMALLWLTGELVGVQLMQHFAVVALLPALVLAIYGVSVGRALLFPLLYLFFAFPWPVAGLTALLQQITAEFSVRVLQLTGFTTVLQGVLIETPFGAWHVAEACSGIKFFIASLALGALYANLFYCSWRRRLVFMLFAFVVPIVANGFRVYFTVVIGEVFGVQYATGTDHLIFGWQFFGTVLLLLFLIGWRWRELPPQETPVIRRARDMAGRRIDPGRGVGDIAAGGRAGDRMGVGRSRRLWHAALPCRRSRRRPLAPGVCCCPRQIRSGRATALRITSSRAHSSMVNDTST